MDTSTKNQVLHHLASLITENQDQMIEENQKDLSNCQHIDPSLLERLKMNSAKIEGMVKSIQQVIDFDDPESQVLYSFQHEKGFCVENKSVPFGKLLIIYESRPDVTIEAAITAFKAGNHVLLKGGKEAIHTNSFLVKLWQQALIQNQIDSNYIQYLNLSRKETQELIKYNTHQVDLIIPRGGESLIDFVTEYATVPVLVSGRGNNFLYVDLDSDFDMAIEIILNGKQRISVCNALDKVLIHSRLQDMESKVAKLIETLQKHQIEVIGDHTINANVQKMENSDVLAEEFLSAKMLVMTISDIDGAIATINKYSGGHSASIITHDVQTAKYFQNHVDCAAVFHNVSTRFTDGSQFGLGAEMAISTQKLHFRGPIGIQQLVTNKWFIHGNGQIRT